MDFSLSGGARAFNWLSMDKEKNKLVIGIVIAVIAFPIAFVFWQKRRIAMAKTEKEQFEKYDGLFKFYARGYPWRWLKAIAKQESDLGQDIRVREGRVSYDNLSYGLMQIATGTGSAKEIELKELSKKRLTDMSETEKEKVRNILNDPAQSIRIASKLVAYLNTKYNGDRDKIFLAYNQGEANTDRGKDYTVNYSANRESYKIKINRWLNWIDRKEKEFLNG